MTTAEPKAPPSLDSIFHPRSVAIDGVSTQQPGFAGVGKTLRWRKGGKTRKT